MFRYDIAERINGATATLATFEASWAASVPIFHEVVRAYFALRRSEPLRELLLYATLESEGEPDRTVLVCSAKRVSGKMGDEVEIRAGPLLEIALRTLRH